MEKYWKFIKNQGSATQLETIELRIEGDIVDDGDLWIYEWFGEPATSPNAFKEELSQYKGKDLTVWISSYGGSVFAAAGIYNALKEHTGKITVKIDDKAMSAASVIAMAGDEILMSPVAIMMIHNPLTSAQGNMHDLRRIADVLDTIKESIINAYVTKTGRSRDVISKMMDEEKWMSANEAVKEQFADGVLYQNSSDKRLENIRNFNFNRQAISNGASESIKRAVAIFNSNSAKIENINLKGGVPMKIIDQPNTKRDISIAFANALKGKEIPLRFKNVITLAEDGAVLLPEEFKGDIDEAKVYNKSMRQYVHVVTVKERKGRYATEDENSFVEMVEFGIDAPLSEQDLEFKGVNWSVKRYGSFSKVTDELFNDSGFDLKTFFIKSHSEKASKTENKLIFNAIRNDLPVKNLEGPEALKTSLNKDLNPALENEIIVVTNQDGYDLFNKLDGNGNPLKYFEMDGPKRYFDIYRFEVYSNDDLPSLNGKAPFIYGSFKRTVKLFTTDTVEALVTRQGGGFLNYHRSLRGVEDYDVKVMPDATQLILGEIPILT